MVDQLILDALPFPEERLEVCECNSMDDGVAIQAVTQTRKAEARLDRWSAQLLNDWLTEWLETGK